MEAILLSGAWQALRADHKLLLAQKWKDGRQWWDNHDISTDYRFHRDKAANKWLSIFPWELTRPQSNKRQLFSRTLEQNQKAISIFFNYRYTSTALHTNSQCQVPSHLLFLKDARHNRFTVSSCLLSGILLQSVVPAVYLVLSVICPHPMVTSWSTYCARTRNM